LFRRAKKKARGASGKKKKSGVQPGHAPEAPEEAPEDTVGPKPVSRKQQTTIDMIDSMLGEDLGEEVLYCSLESIDRIGERPMTGLLDEGGAVAAPPHLSCWRLSSPTSPLLTHSTPPRHSLVPLPTAPVPQPHS
jgi:hypothetical protein